MPQEEEPQEEEPQEEAPPASENNHVNFMLFQSGGVRNEPDLNHMTSPLPKFTSQDLEDPEDLEEPQLDPQLGTSVQQTCTDLVQDSLKVADPRIAELVDRTVLVGLELGSTVLKVNTPPFCFSAESSYKSGVKN